VKNKLLIFISFALIYALPLMHKGKAQAADLGKMGESSDIAEEDFERHIVNQLEALGEDKLKAHQELIKDKMVAKIRRPRAVKNISVATNSASRIYDPSFTVEEDIYGEQGQLFYARGTRINPLEKKAFDEVWIFIDGDDVKQTNFAKYYQEALNKAKTKKIILLNGEPGMQKDGSFFFFDQGGEISRKLNITKVPSIVRQAPNETQILIEEIALRELEDSDKKTNQGLRGLDE
jgi:conjugal transfer pilus assembly protein TraW